MEFYRKYRPKKPSEVVGQAKVVALLRGYLERKALPHALLFTGPSGVGKTTLARILKRALNCSDQDFVEVNTADFRGIDMVREIRERMGSAPLGGTCRIWLIDEAAKLSGDAQDALLKMLEDAPGHVYFMLATTDPQKLHATIKTRCTELKLGRIEEADLRALVARVAAAEGLAYSDAVVARVADVADGSARKALVILDALVGVEGEEAQLAAVAAGDFKAQAIEICRVLVRPGTAWPECAKLVEAVKDDPEQIRRLILGYTRSIILKGGKLAARAYFIGRVFQDPWYGYEAAGLTLCCYEVMTAK
jgi:DNA polymerase III gamma/tau subunit